MAGGLRHDDRYSQRKLGRVLGVVTGMHVVNTMSSSSAIGYVIPVAELGEPRTPR